MSLSLELTRIASNMYSRSTPIFLMLRFVLDVTGVKVGIVFHVGHNARLAS
uniref:Uncharacterized protein n=1 Tax=Anguilla anguilla TaxID=7936 RepID=A0A0E9W6B8_ANGAN